MSITFEKIRPALRTGDGKGIRTSLHGVAQRFAIAASFVIVAASVAIL